MPEEKRLEYKKKHAARSRNYWRNLSPENVLHLKIEKRNTIKIVAKTIWKKYMNIW